MSNTTTREHIVRTSVHPYATVWFSWNEIETEAGCDRFATASPPGSRKSAIFVRAASPLYAGVLCVDPRFANLRRSPNQWTLGEEDQTVEPGLRLCDERCLMLREG